MRNKNELQKKLSFKLVLGIKKDYKPSRGISGTDVKRPLRKELKKLLRKFQENKSQHSNQHFISKKKSDGKKKR